MTDQQLVVDASVLVQLYVKDAAEKFTDVDIVRRHVGGTLELVAPQLILYEVPSAIRRAVSADASTRATRACPSGTSSTWNCERSVATRPFVR